MATKPTTALVLTSLAILWGTTAFAEQGETPTEAKRVRVTAVGLGGKPLTGDLIAIEETKLTVRRAGSSEVIEIPRGDVTQFEVSTKRSRKGRAAGIGALVGLGVGAAIGYAAGDDCDAPDAPSIVCISRPASAAGVGLVGAGLGAVLGWAFAPGERWKFVDPAGVLLTFTPSPIRSGGIGVALSVRF